MTALSACGAEGESAESIQEAEATEIVLSDDGITVDGGEISTDETAAVYMAHDIVFYLEGQDFTYGEGGESDAHSQAEADAHTVVHITKPGTYSISGSLSAGQIAVDLGEDAKEAPEAVVTLILNGVDITCTVAPAVIFYNVYECGSDDAETAQKDVDTTAAGANVIIADGTINSVNGSYVARIYKSYTLSGDGSEVVDSKKLHKYDGAFYSKMSMNVGGGQQENGILNIRAENEGLDSELHLTINGGIINIQSGNDGINTNEDGVSVTTINGGTLNIQVTGETGEGDGIDSNGWLVINGGTVVSAACGDSMDAGLDADMGIEINGGIVMASGNMYDTIDSGNQSFAVFSFAERQTGGTLYSLKDAEGNVVEEWRPANDFTYLVVSAPDLPEGDCTFWQGETQLAGSIDSSGGMGRGMGGPRADDGVKEPAGEERPELGEAPELPDGAKPPQSMTLPEGAEQTETPRERPKDDGRKEAGMGQGEGPEAAEASTVFTLAAGSNFFSRIAPAE